jgi:hypothetical protein
MAKEKLAAKAVTDKFYKEKMNDANAINTHAIKLALFDYFKKV